MLAQKHFLRYSIVLLLILGKWSNSFSQETIQEDSIYFSNTFTPNKDGINDYYIIKGIENYSSNTFKVFTNYGLLVYSIENYLNDWDGVSNYGSFSGKELEIGLYYFQFSTKNGINISGKLILER